MNDEAPLSLRIAVAVPVKGTYTYLVPESLLSKIKAGCRGMESWQQGLDLNQRPYKFDYAEEGLSAGCGIHTAGIKLDYAYSAFGAFNLVNRVSVGVLFYNYRVL